jgi:TatD DNase family protein
MADYELIDTHCHLYLDEFATDLTDYLKRAADEGVKRIYMPALDEHHFLRMTGVEDAHGEICKSMIGVHPCYVRENFRDELDFIEKKIGERNFSAIGEIGLDYYWERTYDEQQMVCFREQIALAKKAKLPFVIHSRNSINEVIEILKEEKSSGIRGIFHCFSGTYENAKAVIDCGFLIGIGGVITYKNAGLAEVVARIGLDHLVLETDAPYLTPVPFRGKRNESSYLKYIVAKMAEVVKVPVDVVAELTTRNAKAIFNER